MAEPGVLRIILVKRRYSTFVHQMAAILGKRKRKSAVIETVDKHVPYQKSESLDIDAQEIFRRHFEAQFKPLPQIEKPQEGPQQAPFNESEEELDWGGISDEEDNVIAIVEHQDAHSRMAAMSKEELKSFMVCTQISTMAQLTIFRSSKPPKSNSISASMRNKVSLAPEDEDASEAANLKKDLALQRLLSESHLLESSKNPTLSGGNRHKATDLRLQSLGAKTSILKQEKMPMSHRRGMIAKQSEREERRRREARENGIILEKAKNGIKKTGDGKRDRGVGAPGIGKFSGGTLKLSKQDIFSIEGRRGSGSSRGNRGGRGGGGSRGRGGAKRGAR